MVKTVDATTARDQIEQLLDQVRDCGDSVIIERDGQPAAALVPLEVLEQQQTVRDGFMEALREFCAGVKTDLTEQEIEQLIDQEVAAVRQERYERERAKECQAESPHRGSAAGRPEP